MSRFQTLEFDKDLTFWLLDELDSELVLERFDFHRFKSLKLLTLQIWDAIRQNERDILAGLLRQGFEKARDEGAGLEGTTTTVKIPTIRFVSPKWPSPLLLSL
jgi:hypothetical protein